MPLILFKVVKIDGDGLIVLLGGGARQQSMQQLCRSCRFELQQDGLHNGNSSRIKSAANQFDENSIRS
jgi:hypothetical protein